MRAWEYLGQLSQLPPRGSATPGERQAAVWLQDRLQELGYDVELQSFMSPRHTLYVGPAIVSGALIVALMLAKTWPAVAAVIAILCFVPLIGEMLGVGPNFNLILPKSSSQNVFARPQEAAGGAGAGGSAQSAESAQCVDVIVVAHYDTQWGSWLFAPSFRPLLQPFFMLTYVALALGLVAVIVSWAAPTAVVTRVLTLIAIGLLVLTGGFLLLACMTGRAVPGANDNGSGVAVALAVAAKWAGGRDDNMRLSFLFTGSEEVGLRGMHHFMKHARLNDKTLFINLDNVGGGRLRYLLGEGMLGYQPYDEGLLAVARRVAEQYDEEIRPLKNLLLPTDALVPAKAGYAAITFLATNEDESIPHYHWHTDTFANADEYTVDQTERYVNEYLHALAERAGVA